MAPHRRELLGRLAVLGLCYGIVFTVSCLVGSPLLPYRSELFLGLVDLSFLLGLGIESCISALSRDRTYSLTYPITLGMLYFIPPVLSVVSTTIAWTRWTAFVSFALLLLRVFIASRRTSHANR